MERAAQQGQGGGSEAAVEGPRACGLARMRAAAGAVRIQAWRCTACAATARACTSCCRAGAAQRARRTPAGRSAGAARCAPACPAWTASRPRRPAGGEGSFILSFSGTGGRQNNAAAEGWFPPQLLHAASCSQPSFCIPPARSTEHSNVPKQNTAMRTRTNSAVASASASGSSAHQPSSGSS